MGTIPSTEREIDSGARIVGVPPREASCSSKANIQGRKTLGAKSHIQLRLLPVPDGFRSSDSRNLGARIRTLRDTSVQANVWGKANIRARGAFSKTERSRARVIYDGGAHPPVEFEYLLSGADDSIFAGESNPLIIAQDIQGISLFANYDIDYPDLGVIEWLATNNYGETNALDQDVTVWEDVSSVVNEEKSHYVFKRFNADGEFKERLNYFGLKIRFVSMGAVFQCYDYRVGFDYCGDPGGLAIGRSEESRANIAGATPRTIGAKSRILAWGTTERELGALARVGYSISGTITGSALEYVQVFVYDDSGNLIDQVQTDESGDYIAWVPRQGAYSVAVSSGLRNLMVQLGLIPAGTEYYSYWHDFEWDYDSADAIAVPDIIDVTLPELDGLNASISGTVLDNDGDPVPTAMVMAIDWATREEATPVIMGIDLVDSVTGEYEIRGLGAGVTYAVVVMDWGFEYDTVLYDGHTVSPGSDPDFSLANAVTGGDTGIDMTMTGAGPPVITSIAPTEGSGGTTVTISGENFNAVQGAGYVSFVGKVATVVSWSSDEIVVTAPEE